MAEIGRRKGDILASKRYSADERRAKWLRPLHPKFLRLHSP